MLPLHTLAATEGSTVGERRDMFDERIPSEPTVDPSLRANVTDARQGASGASPRMTDMGHGREPSYVVILKEPPLQSMLPLHTLAATEGSTVGERRDMIGERIPSERTVDPW
jgi:hypothetical protein